MPTKCYENSALSWWKHYVEIGCCAVTEWVYLALCIQGTHVHTSPIDLSVCLSVRFFIRPVNEPIFPSISWSVLAAIQTTVKWKNLLYLLSLYDNELKIKDAIWKAFSSWFGCGSPTRRGRPNTLSALHIWSAVLWFPLFTALLYLPFFIIRVLLPYLTDLSNVTFAAWGTNFRPLQWRDAMCCFWLVILVTRLSCESVIGRGRRCVLWRVSRA